MSTTASALTKYTAAREALQAHEAQNQAVFNAHKALVNNIIDAENDLRDAVSEAKEGLENDMFRVTFTPQTQTWADIEAIDKLISQGWIDAKFRDQIVKTTERPGRISISEVK